MSRTVCTPFVWICWGIRRDPSALEHYDIVAYSEDAEAGAFLHEPPHSGRLALCAGRVDARGRQTALSREDMDALARTHAAKLRVAGAIA